MAMWWLGCILGVLGASALAFIWLAVKVGNGGGAAKKQETTDFIQAAEDDVERIFNKEFREELRNRGRRHFGKIIGESAMFLQQRLRLTTSQLNAYTKRHIT